MAPADNLDLQTRMAPVKKAVLAGLMVLAGCDHKADERICLTALSDITPGDVDGCVHKWGYRLAGGPDSAETVAKAVVQGCIDVVKHYSEKSPDAKAAQAVYHTTPAQMYSDTLAKAEGWALFYVAQARAGHCNIP